MHSCVIATIRLFMPDGSEARPLSTNAIGSIAADYGLLLEEYHGLGGHGLGGGHHSAVGHGHGHGIHPNSSGYGSHPSLQQLHQKLGGLGGGPGGGPSGGGGVYGPHHHGSSSYLTASHLSITPSQLIELSHFIKDAMHKQALLESQLESMKTMMAAALENAKTGWTKLVEEDRLLSRIESLQAQMEVLLIAKAATTTSKTASEKEKESGVHASEEDEKTANELASVAVETMKLELLHVIADKEAFELSTKHSLAVALEEKMTALSNLHLAEIELASKEEQVHRLDGTVASNLKEMQALVTAGEKARKDVEELLAKLVAAEEEQAKAEAKYEQELTSLKNRLAAFEAAEALRRSQQQEEEALKKEQKKEDEKTKENTDSLEEFKSHASQLLDVSQPNRDALQYPGSLSSITASSAVTSQQQKRKTSADELSKPKGISVVLQSLSLILKLFILNFALF